MKNITLFTVVRAIVASFIALLVISLLYASVSGKVSTLVLN